MATQQMVVPSGTVTFLFAEIDGMNRLRELHPEQMHAASTRFDAILADEIERSAGYSFKNREDVACAAFHTAHQAMQVALAVQTAAASEAWPGSLSAKVRMALHTGVAEIRDHGYFGKPLNRIARLLASGYGGQILVSKVTCELIRDRLPAECSLKDLGEQRLRDLSRPEHVFQLEHPRLSSAFPHLKVLSSPELRNNLPVQTTSFIGREKEIADIRALLKGSNLLTLTGAGGSGKTRLAMQLGADVLEEYRDGVWLVEAAALADDRLLAATVAHVLGIPEQPGKSPEESVIQGIGDKRLLVILDNCEHMVVMASRLASFIVSSCPGVTMLVTSREALGCPGEQIYRVPSLALPDLSKPNTPQSVSYFEAVRLFIDRAMLVKGDFQVTLQNAPSLVQICARLDGIPLAIELASARIRSLTVEEINDQLERQFRRLTGGNRAALPRQQTLRALIDWSYDTVDPHEKILLNRLSVFAGGWSLESAKNTCGGDGIGELEVADLISDLVDQSFVIVDEHSGSVRYRMHETVRHYCAEILQASGDIDRVKTRHCETYLALAEEAEPHVKSTQRRRWLDLLEREHDNLRSSLEWCAQESNGDERGLRLSSALERFWYFRGFWSEGREHLRRALDRPGAQNISLPRARALLGSGRLAYVQGEYQAAREALSQSLDLNRHLDDSSGLAATLQMLGLVAMREGDYSQARALLEECQGLLTKLGDKPGAASQLLNLGIVSITLGDFDTAKIKCEAALALGRELGEKNIIASSLCNLAEVGLFQTDYHHAQAHLQEALEMYQDMGSTIGIAYSLFGLGCAAVSLHEYGEARQHLTESLRLQVELGNRLGIAEGLEGAAAFLLAQSRTQLAVQLWGAAEVLRETIGAHI